MKKDSGYKHYRLKTVAMDEEGVILKPAEWREMKGKGFVFHPSLDRKGLKKIK